MPIEIKELSIKVSATDQRPAKPTPTKPQVSAEKKETLIAECLEQVAELLSNKKER